MAIVKCKECGNEISTKATSCPKCGARVKRTSGCAKFALGFIVLCVIVGIIGSQLGERTKTDTAERAVAGPARKTPDTSSGWQYSTQLDKINNKTSIFNQLESNNSIEYGFPYGNQKMTLTVRKAPSDGTSVYVSLRKGQLICDISRGCPVKARFDSLPPMTFTGRTPSDYSSDTLFLFPEEKFIANLRKSKNTVIEVVFYQHGAVQYEFSTDGFQWK
jgi:hypothetical protein